MLSCNHKDSVYVVCHVILYVVSHVILLLVSTVEMLSFIPETAFC